MAQINMPQKKESPLDTIMKGLTIASQVYGIRADSAKLEEHQKAEEKQARLDQGIYNKGELAQLGEKYDISDSPMQNSIKAMSQDTGKEIYLTPKRDNSPIYKEISGTKNGVEGTYVKDYRNPSSPTEVDFIPKTKSQELVTLESVDAQGNPITIIVPKEAGASYAKAKKDEKPSKEQFDAALYGKRIETANQVLSKLEDQGYNRASTVESLKAFAMPERLKSSELKQQEQAERNFLNATLRRESGANINKDEFASGEAQYFPRAGDTPEVLAQKAQNRQQALEGMKAAAGIAWDKVPSVPIAGVKKTDGQAFSAPANSGPSTLQLIQQKAASGDKKAQEYLKSLTGGQ